MLTHVQAHGSRAFSARCVHDLDAPPDPRLLRVIHFMGDRLGEGLSLTDLATVAGLSPNHFARVFKRTFGVAPHRYLVRQRIARACELLGDPRRSLVEVSYTVGFSSQSHLNMVFRRYLRTTPAAYRQQIIREYAIDPALNAARARGERTRHGQPSRGSSRRERTPVH